MDGLSARCMWRSLGSLFFLSLSLSSNPLLFFGIWLRRRDNMREEKRVKGGEQKKTACPREVSGLSPPWLKPRSEQGQCICLDSFAFPVSVTLSCLLCTQYYSLLQIPQTAEPCPPKTHVATPYHPTAIHALIGS